MGKGRKPPSRGRGDRVTDVSRQAEPLERTGDLGNQEIQLRLGSGASRDAIDMEVVRDVARPLITHAILALQLEPRPAAAAERLLGLVQGSNLSEERKDELTARLGNSARAASAVAEAVQSAIGTDGMEERLALVRQLDQLDRFLGEGEASGATWRTSATTVEIDADGSLTARADALVEGLADATSGPAGAREVVALCRTLYLAVMLDEEEEEGPPPGDYAAEESGW